MNILVTGVAGFIGFHTAKKLLIKWENKVVGIDNINNYYDKKIKLDRLKILKKISGKNFKFFKKDISNYNDVEKIFKINSINYVINLAAQAGCKIFT